MLRREFCTFLIVDNWRLQRFGLRIFCLTGTYVLNAANGRYKVVFCDTDRVPALETKRGDRTTNDTEAALIKQVFHPRNFTDSRRSILFVREVSHPPQSE